MKQVLLSFDIEEFDMPMEYGKNIPFNEQIRISADGTKTILGILRDQGIQATFFSTVNFAKHASDLIKRIGQERHELGSHGYYHSSFEKGHLLQSRIELEEISHQNVVGFRMARMMPVDNNAIQRAGYLYNSSLNPVYLPGRYNNFLKPRKLHNSNSLIQIPASATPFIRFPLFWLSFHNLPQWLYRAACVQTINSDSYLNIYFHPWEFEDLSDPAFGLPRYVSRNSGAKMIERFYTWTSWIKKRGYSFTTISKFVGVH